MKYLIIGLDAQGEQHTIGETRFAVDADRLRQAEVSAWSEVFVVGSEGRMSQAELAEAVMANHSYR